MSRHQIKRLLKKYTQSPEYWSTLTAGAPRIDLEGNPVGAVTAADEEHAKRKIAKTARRAAAKTIATAGPRPNLLRGPHNKTRSRGQNLNGRRRPNHHVSGWLASRRPHRVAGRGSSPRSDPGSVAA
jgi:sRNA-binding protein